MAVAKGDSHQTNPWAVCAHWLRGQTLVCDIRGKHEYSRWALEVCKSIKGTEGTGHVSFQTFDIHFSTFAIEKNRGNSTLTLYKLFTYSLNRLVCFKLLIPLQNIGHI